MAEFPTYEQMAKDVAEKALDEYQINGKTLREWIKIIAEKEPCEDCISRRAVLDEINKSVDHSLYAYKSLIECVKILPSVTPIEPTKTGHWTIKQYQVPVENKRVPTISDITFLPIEPTACKTVYTYTHSACKSEEYLNKHNYCPNCGCKMEG